MSDGIAGPWRYTAFVSDLAFGSRSRRCAGEPASPTTDVVRRTSAPACSIVRFEQAARVLSVWLMFLDYATRGDTQDHDSAYSGHEPYFPRA
jgi:hypothetical protein